MRRGVRRILGYAVALAALSLGLLALMFVPLSGSGEHVFSAIASFAILQGMYRALYWLPYRVGAVHTHSTHSRASMLREAAVAIAPALIGIVLGTAFNLAPLLLLAAAALMLISIIPIILMPEHHERFSWTYAQTLDHLFSYPRRHLLKQSIYDGIQGASLLFIWPLAVFIVLDWSFVTLGLVLSLSILVSLALRRLIRSLLQSLHVQHSHHVAATLVFSLWIVRLGVGTPMGIIAIDSLYTSASSPLKFGIDAHGRDQSADLSHFIDEDTALKEMGLALGRIGICALLGMLALLFSDAVAFVSTLTVAGFAAAASVYGAHRNAHQRI